MEMRSAVRFAKALAATCIALCCAGTAAPQETHASPPPNILVITREFLKPGRSGATHEKAEGLYIQALNRAKSDTRYIGMEALSGKSRALFFSGYDSFAAWREAEKADDKDGVMSAAMARADIADGDLLDSVDHSVWLYDPDNSQQGPVDMAKVRYFEIELFQVRPGHDEWLELSKLLKAAYAKAMPSRHWAFYDNMFGLPESSFLVITPLQSVAEIDEEIAAGPKFMAAIGEDGMKRAFVLESAAVVSSEMNLFIVDPKMSRPPESWVKADPSFWRSRPAVEEGGKKPTKASAEKPQ